MNKITLVGNYVEMPDNSRLNAGGASLSVAFIGKMDYEPNVLAVEYFCKEVLPDVTRQIPELKFHIVGAKPDRRVLKLDAIPNVVVTGFVESVEPYFLDSALIIAPMLTGSGIQNKIIQAMAYGCCVITTPIGAEGIEMHNSGLAICSGKENWIETVIKYINDKELRTEMGRRARKYVEENMSKDIVRKQFITFLNKINN